MSMGIVMSEDYNTSLTKLEAHLLSLDSKTYKAYYEGRMSYTIASADWTKAVNEQFPDLKQQKTSENIFKTVVDLYAENLMPMPKELKGFSASLVPLLARGKAVVVVDQAGTAHYPTQFELIADGSFSLACIFTRSLKEFKDFITFVYSDGTTRVFSKPVPDDLSAPSREGYKFVEQESGSTLFVFDLDDGGMGGGLAALQDRVNHSIIDQTVIAEMYARPFWYLLNANLMPKNPFLPVGMQQDVGDELKESDLKHGGPRMFTTSAEGPFGQLEPPTLGDVIAYHDSILDKVSQTSGIPQHYFKPGEGTPPTGVALKVLSKRFNNKIARLRDDIRDVLEELAAALGVEKTLEVKSTAKATPTADGGEQVVNEEPKVEYEYEFWDATDDLLQESMDAHGIALSQMGYPLEYIASVVTPGVDLADYVDDSLDSPVPNPQGGVDMTAMGQTGLPATPGQVASYAANPGQRATPTQ